MKTEIVTYTPKGRDQAESDRVGIVRFFLTLFKHQLDVPKTALGNFKVIRSGGDESDDFIYELYVERNNKHETRRMAITVLGEGSGSKSKCFKAVYDSLLVIKIPPSPITDFREYIENIKAERRIALKLAPNIEFVVPGVSVILKRVYPFPDAETLTPIELEKRYIKWLEDHPPYQEFLKIGNAFVFVMDLSKYSFLSNIVDNIHDPGAIQNRINEEIITSHNLIWDILGFEGKYGSENLSICFNMNKVYADYETEVNALLKEHGNSTSVSPYQKQEWFCNYLTGKEVAPNSGNVSLKLAAALNISLKRIFENNSNDIEMYRDTVSRYVRQVIFMQKKPKMGEIITNILELLAWLKEKGIAIRDLKPDNLFEVEDKEKQLTQLTGDQKRSLGLIDFETAVEFKLDGDKLAQPLLGGTPSYATPSHIFENDLLTQIFPDVSHILHLQDWHAVIGMIFNVVTGECLFEQTRRMLTKMIHTAQKQALRNHPLEDIFKKGSRAFWSSALNEFKDRTKIRGKILRSIEAYLPENAKKMLQYEIRLEQQEIARRIKKRVTSQVIFSSDKNRRNLIQSSLQDISRYREKWEKGINTPQTPPEVKEEIIRLLKDLESMKSKLEEKRQLIERLKDETLKMSVDELLEIMFSIVLSSMYAEEWGNLSSKIYDPGYSATDVPTGKTILYESTIMY